MIRWSCAVAAAALLTMPAAAERPLPAGLARLAPADFTMRTTVHDDPLDSAIVFSTAWAHRRGQAMDGAFADDVHLRAKVDRVTGQVTWQVWHDLINFRHKARIAAVDYAAGGNVRTAQAVQVEQWQDACQMADVNAPCFVHQRVVFDLPESVVREIAASWQSGSRSAWPLRFAVDGGDAIRGGLAPAEAAGLLSAVANWRKGGV
ncbi:hypothetical protein H7F51_11230 [Novosphingobium flavum]|uniref:Uncharacterized protein n=1 Tax=Novosphingobium flavum TaxID=1778672 RepID=A0A7X1KLZ0_9SPHN|nr:hypothetical protein [Novosphingobium flavum]MBC2666089.1 hypothetical protein [Novosphingobium flavum]